MCQHSGQFLHTKHWFSYLSSSLLITPHHTDLALSFWCLNPTRPVLRSAQVKVSSRISSLGFISWPPVSSPSPPLNRTSCPLLGLWMSWKISCSVGLSGSFTWIRYGDSGAKPSRGTSREPLMWRAGGWVFTEKKTGETRVRLMKQKNRCSFIKLNWIWTGSQWPEGMNSQCWPGELKRSCCFGGWHLKWFSSSYSCSKYQ